MNVGEFDTLVELRFCTVGAGSDGQKTKTWTSYGNVWAKVETDVSESVDDYNLASGRTVRLTMWRIAAKDKDQLSWRVYIDGEPYEVTGKATVEKFYTSITARAINQ